MTHYEIRNTAKRMDPQTLVWVKLEGYPWWPAVVVDHVAMGHEDIPEGKDALVQYFGTGDAGFVDTTDAREVALFQPEFDKDKIDESAGDPMCAEAVQAALALWQAAVDASLRGMPSETMPEDGSSSSSPEASVREKDAKHKKDKKDKKSKKERKKEKREKREKRRREKHRDSDEDDDDDNDNREAEKSRRKLSQSGKGVRPRENANLEASGARRENNVMNRQQMHHQVAVSTKVMATTKDLLQLRDALEAAVEEHQQPTARALLSKLSRIVVTYSQLKSTRIGVTVGKLLGKEFPFCHVLATAILKFWFSQIPPIYQRRLTAQDCVELASKASVEGSDRDVKEDMANLHAFGVQLERCFMVEEEELLLTEEREGESMMSPVAGDDAVPPFTDPTAVPLLTNPTDAKTKGLIPASRIARVLEACAEKHPETVRHYLLGHLSNSDHRQQRLDLLTGVQSPESCVEYIAGLWYASQSGGGATEMPQGSEKDWRATVLDETVEDEYANVSHLFTCPECKATSASTSEMMTGSHGEDHTVVTWASCTKCHHGWKVGGDD